MWIMNVTADKTIIIGTEMTLPCTLPYSTLQVYLYDQNIWFFYYLKVTIIMILQKKSYVTELFAVWNMYESLGVAVIDQTPNS